ncbi:hypothetical protein [Enterococcus faecium]|mgnify:CR=1 FL=1|uniref:hypothetical protein n=1 Tax=Enterococcus faecium TaxID=1352 RepID=UPI001F28BB25|nr:hypothetical protein [Enterococcus faecium]MCF8638441.1 hypothetical protein [Enterococcus faecium]
MKNLQKHFMNITKTATDSRPNLKNVFYDETDNYMKATDSFRALSFKNDFTIEQSVLINPMTLEYSTRGHYPDINRLNNQALIANQSLIFKSDVDLSGFKKVISMYKRKGMFLRFTINGAKKEVIVKNARDEILQILEIESIYDEQLIIDVTLSGLYLYHLIEFLNDYRKECKNKLTVYLNNSTEIVEIVRPFLITDNDKFIYLLSPIRTRYE